MTNRNWKFLIGGLVVVAAIGVLVGVSVQENSAYYIEVGDYVGTGGASLPRHYRVHGHVLPGTIEKTPGKLGVVFAMGDGGKQMTVRFAREVPDTFVEKAEVVVEVPGWTGSRGAHSWRSVHPVEAAAVTARARCTPEPAAGPAGPLTHAAAREHPLLVALAVSTWAILGSIWAPERSYPLVLSASARRSPPGS
jgi:hypothetical protein